MPTTVHIPDPHTLHIITWEEIQEERNWRFLIFRFFLDGHPFRLMMLSKDKQNLLKIISFDFLIVCMQVKKFQVYFLFFLFSNFTSVCMIGSLPEIVSEIFIRFWSELDDPTTQNLFCTFIFFIKLLGRELHG